MSYTTSSAPLPYVEPYVQDVLGRAQDVANTPYQQSPSTAVGPNPYLTAGWEATANRAIMGSPTMGAANSLMQRTLNGDFLSSENPYLASQIDYAQGDLARNFNNVNKPGWDARMARSGGYNSGVAEAASGDYGDLARNMGRIGSDMRFNAYNTERGHQQTALGLAPTYANQDYVDANALLSVGTQRQAFDQAGADQELRWFNEAQNYPQQRLNDYARIVGMGSGAGSTTSQPGPSTGSSIFGGALTGAALYNLLFGGG